MYSDALDMTSSLCVSLRVMQICIKRKKKEKRIACLFAIQALDPVWTCIKKDLGLVA